MNEREPLKSVGLQDLYPQLSEDDVKKAGEALDRYLEVVIRIYKHIQEDQDTYSRFKALTTSARHPTMKSKRSK